ncbi:hypothetical protein A2U01_0012323 [Trifolium medium]|uniref:Uncharacterized protein n=1 Tax=Trifolium medium TaxID=97028 RepID=A0A392MV28_9FABA|nr:hypothetical protein [Trifolium medium]
MIFGATFSQELLDCVGADCGPESGFKITAFHHIRKYEIGLTEDSFGPGWGIRVMSGSFETAESEEEQVGSS